MALFIVLFSSFIFSLCYSPYLFFLLLMTICLSTFLSPFYFSFVLVDLILVDDLSLFITFMLLCVIFCSSFWSYNHSNQPSILLLFSSIILLCWLVFSSSSLLILYVSYEISLIPIIIIIVIWGSYPERSLSSLMLLLYTSIFTIPFIFVLFYIFDFNSSFSLPFIGSSVPPFFSFLLFSVFAVKLPIYGLHFWLPIAHVEAPTFGSIILAGVLLKLGGVGLIRCYNIIDWVSISFHTTSYFLLFLLYVTLVCSFQSDFKRLIAYSSVSHMIIVPILLISYSLMSHNALFLLLLFHGFSSPLLFSIVGYVYSIYSSRQIVSIRGLLLSSPTLSLIIILAFMFTLCVPPFPSYCSEVMFFISSVNLWSMMPLLLTMFSFLSLIYNLNWLSSSLFSNSSLNSSYSSSYFPYFYFYSMFIFVFIGFSFIPIFSYI